MLLFSIVLTKVAIFFQTYR